MSNSQKWINRQIRLGWASLAGGIVLALVGLALPRLLTNPSFNTRIITGLGILLLGIGTAYLVRYSTARRDPRAAGRMAIEEHDERTLANRSRAAGHAYWVSAAITYTGLMWSSFAANGSLPDLSGDTLWFFLAAAVLVPFAVYLTGIILAEQNN